MPRNAPSALAAWLLVAAAAARGAAAWRTVSVEDFGAKGDNSTVNTKAFRAALASVAGGGEVVVPAGGCFRTAPVNLTSNVVLRVDGTMRAVEDREAFPIIGVLPSVGHDYDTNGPARYQSFVFAVGGRNISIVGKGVIDGAGAYWWTRASRQLNHGVGRPHLLELQNITDVVVTGVTLLNSPFWTFHPVYCTNVHIHHMQIQIPWLATVDGQQISGFNGDGIDVDSCQNVLIEHNYINCGDDHVTILSGVGKAGQDFAMPSKNITVSDNRLGSGMGLSVGSSVSGGVEDVLYTRNVMNETSGQWGMGVHIKTRTTYGGYIRNIVYEDNVFETAGVPGGAIHIESGYQSGHGKSCSYSDCTDIRDIVFRNLTFVHSGGTGGLVCFPARPCQNITFENVHVENQQGKAGWSCNDVASGSFIDVTPPRSDDGNCNFTSSPDSVIIATPAPPPPPQPPVVTAAKATVPFWSAPKPDGTRMQGYSKIPGLTDHLLYRPETEADGRYNHAAMLMYHRGVITVSWKNAPLEEDTPGQRVLFSQSSDGVHWTTALELFPSMNSASTPSAQFAGPFAVLNGRLYASASPAIIKDGDAQGAQFCQWPDGLDPRNCNCPGCGGHQPAGLLMLREVLPGGEGKLGPVFWGTKDGPPKEYEAISKAKAVKELSAMDQQTQADVRLLDGRGVADGFQPPCNTSDTGSGTLKCEACPNGCQIYDLTPKKPARLANERAYYPVPHSSPPADVQLFRAHSGTLWATVRDDLRRGQSNWSAVVETNIPNDNSNLNAGVLPDGKGVFLLSNAAPAKIRDPLTISLSKDGYNFSKCLIVQTCMDMAGGESTCKARQARNGNVGPSYPQGLSVVAPAPEAMQGLYVVATNNKEDVVLTRVPWDSLTV